MAWTQDDIDALRQAIATGASKVRYRDGREVTYRSLADMRTLLDEMIASVAGQPRNVVSFAQHSRE